MFFASFRLVMPLAAWLVLSLGVSAQVQLPYTSSGTLGPLTVSGNSQLLFDTATGLYYIDGVLQNSTTNRTYVVVPADAAGAGLPAAYLTSFEFTTISIGSGVTINVQGVAPLLLLASGDADIDGSFLLNGEDGGSGTGGNGSGGGSGGCGMAIFCGGSVTFTGNFTAKGGDGGANLGLTANSGSIGGGGSGRGGAGGGGDGGALHAGGDGGNGGDGAVWGLPTPWGPLGWHLGGGGGGGGGAYDGAGGSGGDSPIGQAAQVGDDGQVGKCWQIRCGGKGGNGGQKGGLPFVGDGGIAGCPLGGDGSPGGTGWLSGNRTGGGGGGGGGAFAGFPGGKGAAGGTQGGGGGGGGGGGDQCDDQKPVGKGRHGGAAGGGAVRGDPGKDGTTLSSNDATGGAGGGGTLSLGSGTGSVFVDGAIVTLGGEMVDRNGVLAGTGASGPLDVLGTLSVGPSASFNGQALSPTTPWVYVSPLGYSTSDMLLHGGGGGGGSGGDGRLEHGFTLSTTGLVAGGIVTVSASNGTPSGTVRWGYSLTGGGPVGTPWGSLLLSPPYTELPAMTMNSSGAGSFTGPIPPGTTGLAVWLHAFDLGSLSFSNGVATTIG